MSMGRVVVHKLSSALNSAVERIRKECGARCKVHWISRRAVQKGDYVVTPNGEIARVEGIRMEKMAPAEVETHRKKHEKARLSRGTRTVPRPVGVHRRILDLVEIWPTRGTSLKHTRPGDKPLKAAFRIRMVGRGVADYDDGDEVDFPGGMGDFDFYFEAEGYDDNDNGMGQGPIDTARFPLESGDTPDTTFMTEQGLKTQTQRLGDEANNFGM